MLDSQKITALLNNSSIQIEVLDTIDSTNDYLKKFISHHNTSTKICLAESMTQGKGRLNKKWFAPYGKNIYFSLLTPISLPLKTLSGLSLVVSLAVCKTLESVAKEKKFFVKWPNDVLINQQKISGILIETHVDAQHICQTIIGIGINVNMETAEQNEITQPWSSLLRLTGQLTDRNLLTATLTHCLLDYLNKFIQHGLNYFHQEWQERDCLFNKSLSLISGTHHYTGIGAGINDQGLLLLKTDDNILKAFSSGETSLLK